MVKLLKELKLITLLCQVNSREEIELSSKDENRPLNIKKSNIQNIKF